MSSSLLLRNDNESFLDQIVMWGEKWILCDSQWWPGQRLDGEEAPVHFPKQNSQQKMCCWSDPLQLNESWQNHYIWEVCSANRWDAPKVATPGCIGQQKGPNSSPCQHPNAHHITTASKVGWIGVRSFASSTIFTLPLANWLLLLQASQQLFEGKMLPQSVRSRKCFPRIHWIPKHKFLCYRNKQTSFLLAKMRWL